MYIFNFRLSYIDLIFIIKKNFNFKLKNDN